MNISNKNNNNKPKNEKHFKLTLVLFCFSHSEIMLHHFVFHNILMKGYKFILVLNCIIIKLYMLDLVSLRE